MKSFLVTSRHGQAQRPAPTQSFRNEDHAQHNVNASKHRKQQKGTAALAYTEFSIEIKPRQYHSNASSGAGCPSEAGTTNAHNERTIVRDQPTGVLVEAGAGYHAQPNVRA